jgi:hypothetical protein
MEVMTSDRVDAVGVWGTKQLAGEVEGIQVEDRTHCRDHNNRGDVDNKAQVCEEGT